MYWFRKALLHSNFCRCCLNLPEYRRQAIKIILRTKKNVHIIRSAIIPAFIPCRLWLKNEFPLHIFKIVMYSIPNQYSYRAIELLFSHLDKHKGSEADMRASIVEMISASVTIATGGRLKPP